MPVEAGSVSRWNDEKGFGFIVQHGTGDSIYVHRTGLVGVDALVEGDEVQYERCQDAIDVKRGKERAGNVRLMNRGDEGGSSGSSAARHGQTSRTYGGRMNGFSGDFSGANPPPPAVRAVPREMRPYGHDNAPYRPEDRPPSQHVSGRLEVGSVKSWNEEKKFGFIVPERGGDSIYVHCTGLSGMEYLRDGDTVEFERYQDPHDMKRGKERAVNVRLLGDSFSKTVSSVGGTTYGYSRQEVRAAPPPPAPKPRIEQGRVSRWNDDKGFGFIVHHATQDSIYVHRTGLIGVTSIHEEDEVEYERFQDARDMERGKERCVNVRVLQSAGARTSSSSLGGGYGHDDHGYSRGRGDAMQGRGDAMQGRGDAAQGWGQHPHSSNRAHPYAPAIPPAPPAIGTFPVAELGSVMSWSDEKGFGFILLEGSKESIYMHRTGLAPGTAVREGDIVEFERTQDPRDVERGKERAVNVRVVTGGSGQGGRDQQMYQNHFPRVSAPQQDYGGYDPTPPPPPPVAYSQENRNFGQADRRFSNGNKGASDGYEVGTVSAWNDDKGFGFIVAESNQESIYVHRTGLLGHDSLQEGDRVEYGRTLDARDVERGKERAVNVRILSGSSGIRGRARSRSPRRR